MKNQSSCDVTFCQNSLSTCLGKKGTRNVKTVLKTFKGFLSGLALLL